MQKLMEAHNTLRENCLFLSNRAETEGHFLANRVHGITGAKLLNDFFERPEVFAGPNFANDETPVLGFAGVPSDEDKLLHKRRVTCSLHLMI